MGQLGSRDYEMAAEKNAVTGFRLIQGAKRPWVSCATGPRSVATRFLSSREVNYYASFGGHLDGATRRASATRTVQHDRRDETQSGRPVQTRNQ